MPLWDYLYEKRRGLVKTAGACGGVVLLGQHISQYLVDMRQTFMEERVAADNLRRRFSQNEQDASYMALGLLPTLAEQILQGMDVEELTKELQSRSRAALVTSPSPPPSVPAPPPDPPFSESNSHDSRTGSQEQSEDSALGTSSLSILSYPSHPDGRTPDIQHSTRFASVDLTQSTSSWVKEFESGSGRRSNVPSSNASTSANEDLSASMSSSAASAASSTNTRSKADLWREVKILTFTRTLTVMYSITLLTVFTYLQLSLLNRIKYVRSVVQLDMDEQERDGLHTSHPANRFSTALRQWLLNDSHVLPIPDTPPSLGPDSEMKYLTMSWWLLHVGWKDVGERVRRAVEEVLDEVSLKDRLTPLELHRMLIDIRRRIEHEVTFEGKEKRSKYTSTLLPSTRETLHHVLTQAGLRVTPTPDLHLPPIDIAIPSTVNGSPILGTDETFDTLLSETADVINSTNFSTVLEAAFDHIFEEVLLSGLLASVFGDKALDNAANENSEPQMRLAAMLPGLTRWSRLALTGLPNEIVERLGGLREVKALSAIVFSSYSAS